MKVLMFLSKEILTDDRVYREAKALVDAGYEVTVIMWDRYGERKLKESVDGIDIVRIRSNGLMMLLPNNLFRNPIWWRLAYKKGLELYRSGYKFDIVHCHDLDTLKIGVWLKKKLGIKLIYDAHEIFGYMIESDNPRYIVNYVFEMEKRLLKNVDHLITVNEPLKNYFEGITDIPITIIMNCKDLFLDEYKPTMNDVFTVSHIGNLHRGRLFPEIIDALGKVEGIRFVIASKKENMNLYREVEKVCGKYNNVEFLGEIPFNEVIPRTLEADVVLNTTSPFGGAKMATPNKLLEALICGRPVISTKDTYAGELTERLQCGLVVDYDVDAFRDAVVKLRDNPRLCEKFGRNALEAAKTKYNWSNMKNRLLKVYKSI